MGKGGTPKIEVTQYYMSEHFGICAQADALTKLTIKEKIAWSGEVDAAGAISINQSEIFGGIKKEGGLQGTAYYLPGDASQVLPDALAQKLGRASGLDCPGFRGLASVFFYGSSGRGFYWTANTPYLPGVWATVRRAPVGLNPSLALIFSGTRTPRAICFALDDSGSMAGTRLATLKSAMATVLNLISASAESGVLIDLAVVTFGDNSTGITRRMIDAGDVDDVDAFVQALSASALDTDFRAGMNAAKTFFDATDAGIAERFLFFITDGEPSDSGGDSAATVASGAAATLATMTGVASYGINIILEDTSFTEQVDNTPGDGVPVVSGDDDTGLISAVTNALFGDDVIGDANPAHMIYECLTNTDWGMGSPTTAIDYDAFDLVSTTLWAEGFGLSMLWTRQASIQDFIQEILDHIQAVLYVDPATGLITLALIRDDYDPDDLDVITPDNADLASFSRKLWGDIVNEIIVTWTNPENEQEETITVQDDGSIAIQGDIISDSRNYYGVRNATLAQNLAMRDLRSAGQPLATMEAEVDRSQWALRPASVIKVTWPEYGLVELVMRVQSIDYGKPGDPTIRLSLIEDVYGLDVGTYDEPPSSSWTDPSAAPEPMDEVEIITLPYYFALGSTVAAFTESPEYPEVVAGVLATSDSDDTFAVELWDELALSTGSLGDYQQIANLNVIGRAELADDLGAEVATADVSFDNFIGKTFPTVAGFVIIGEAGEATNEIAQITDDAGGDYDLTRGVLDTVPRFWPAGTKVWFLDESALFEDTVIRAAGEVVDYKLLSRTSIGLLALADAPVESETLIERPWLPNRPANVVAYGEAWSSSANIIDARARPDPWVTVSWAIRNRLDEDSLILAWDDASGTAETGQTTTIEVRTEGDVLIATHDGIAGTSFDVPDVSFGGNATVRLRIYSERSDDDGDFVSLQYFEHWVQVADGSLVLDDGDLLLTEDGDTVILEG